MVSSWNVNRVEYFDRLITEKHSSSLVHSPSDEFLIISNGEDLLSVVKIEFIEGQSAPCCIIFAKFLLECAQMRARRFSFSWLKPWSGFVLKSSWRVSFSSKIRHSVRQKLFSDFFFLWNINLFFLCLFYRNDLRTGMVVELVSKNVLSCFPCPRIFI